MGIFSDATDWVSDRVDDVKDAASDVVSSVPGSEWLGDQVTDFLKTDVGSVVGHALATSLYGWAAPIVGPQLAAAAFATPGLIRGDRFSKAWIEEFEWRVERLAEILGDDAGREFASQIGPALDKLKGDFPQLQDLEKYSPDIVPTLPPVQEVLDIPPWKIALPRSLREDLTALAISGLTKVAIDVSNYDLVTGKDMAVTDEQRAKLLHPYASTLVAAQMRSTLADYLQRQAREQQVARHLQSNISRYYANQVIPSSPPAPPAPAPVAPVPTPPLVQIPNPLLRTSAVAPSSPRPWYKEPWVAVAATAGVAGLVGFWIWRTP